jgi:hypothetical protein
MTLPSLKNQPNNQLQRVFMRFDASLTVEYLHSRSYHPTLIENCSRRPATVTNTRESRDRNVADE